MKSRSIAPRVFMICLVLLLGGLWLSPAGQALGVTDKAISKSDCQLLGRRWQAAGCSRRQCHNPRHVMFTGTNVEVCRIPGASGGDFATLVPYLRCKALHRVWVPSVNYCLSNPVRSTPTISRAAQCVSPYTTYVTHTEIEGNYDECLTPARVDELQVIARQTKQSLNRVAAERSVTLCSYRPNKIFENGTCHQLTRLPDRSTPTGTLIIGDSITWRGNDELSRRRPDWTIDGVPRRPVAELTARLKTYLVGHAPPQTLIIALGSNPSAGWTKQDYLAAIDLVPASEHILFVTPYRQPLTRPEKPSSKTGQVTRNNQLIQAIAQQRRKVCLADWRQRAIDQPALLADGVHATRSHEATWAQLVSDSYQRCQRS